LNLASNSINSLSSDAFGSLTSLQNLDLGSNGIPSIENGLFNSLTSLQNLDMGGNSLTSLPPDVFQNLENLQSLDLSGNSLTSLPPDLFYNQNSLQELSINDNQLTSIPESVLNKVGNVQNMDLSGNCIDCSNPLYSSNKQCKDNAQTQCPTSSGCSRSMLWKGCIRCSDNGDDAFCYDCSEGYTLNRGKCNMCLATQCCPENATDVASSNCARCSNDRKQCSICVSEYTLHDGMCTKKASSGSSLVLSFFALAVLVASFVLFL